MEKINESYKIFLKEESLVVEETFVDYYRKNNIELSFETDKGVEKISIIDYLNNLENSFKCVESLSIYSGYFLKKMNIVQNVLSLCDTFKFSSDKLPQAMNIYEELIKFISETDNIYVNNIPSFIFNNKTFSVECYKFKNIEEFKEKFIEANKKFSVYHFHLNQNNEIILRGCFLNKKEEVKKIEEFFTDNDIEEFIKEIHEKYKDHKIDFITKHDGLNKSRLYCNNIETRIVINKDILNEMAANLSQFFEGYYILKDAVKNSILESSKLEIESVEKNLNDLGVENK